MYVNDNIIKGDKIEYRLYLLQEVETKKILTIKGLGRT